MSGTEYNLVKHRGLYAVRWSETVDGKPRRSRRSLGTTERSEALRRLEDFKRDMEAPVEVTVTNLWDAYCKDLEGRAIVATMAAPFKNLKPDFGHLRPDQLSRHHFRAYTAKRRGEGARDGTIRTELSRLRNVLSWAVRTELIEKAPFVERPAETAPRERWLTREEIKKFFAAIEADHFRLWSTLMLTSAARPTAILELEWDRVDLNAGIIQLAVEGQERRKGRATVPINETARKALLDARKEATIDRVIEFRGEPVASIKTAFRATVGRAKIAHCTPHDFRRTAGHLLLEGGTDIAVVAQYLGHTDPKITRRVYARHTAKTLATAAKALEFDI